MVNQLGETLQARFGFSQFKPGQLEVMSHLLEGRSAAAVFPTGGGKSLCYQAPALLLEGLTLVVSPLIALMKDQIDALTARGVAAARLDSTLSADEYRHVAEDTRAGRLKLLYVAPERFNNERFRESIQRTRISLFAVDEAHCISEWGHNFRPDYLKLAQFAKQCQAERVLALTATATENVLADICRFFEIDPARAIRTGFYRPNLTLLATPVTSDEQNDALLRGLRERPPGPTIVYVSLQRTAEEVAARLARQGFPARAYHAGMKDEERAETQDWFIASDKNVVVATIAFGMGIDKANIRYVYHYNPPKSLENYSQEIGRAGRDGAPATCELLFCPDDVNVLENFVHGDTPTEDAVRGLLREVFSLGPQFDVSFYDLSGGHDIRILVVRTLLTYLELLGYLEGGTPFYSDYQFKPLMPSAEVLANFEGERREFVANVLRESRKAKTWFHVDVDEAARVLGCDRERIVRALDYLGEQQMLEVQAAGVRNRFRRLRMPDDLESLADKLSARTQERETRELARLRQVQDWVTLDGCQVNSLCGYFAENRGAPCGHCSWCLSGRSPAVVPTRHEPALPDEVFQQAIALRRKHPRALAGPRELARFLCGVSSPALTKAKLTGEALFGALESAAFSEVLQRVEELADAS